MGCVTMAALDGAGLAAPQIGVGLQVMIFGIDHNPRYPDAEAVPQTILINPKLTALTEDVAEDWEGCLSVPGMRGVVPRFTRLRYEGFEPRSLGMKAMLPYVDEFRPVHNLESLESLVDVISAAAQRQSAAAMARETYGLREED